MKWRSSRWPLTTLLFVIATSAGGQTASAHPIPPGGRYPSTQDDAEFMQGMIMHHAQAIVMAHEAVSHGASNPVQIFCARIALSQSGEIGLMQRWLAARKYDVPDSTGKMPGSMAGMAGMSGMSGMSNDAAMLMPGMLTAEQMKLLDDARGASWDRLFLVFMIQHHTGALTMVDKLFASPAGGQDEEIFKFATAVHADQTAEIDRMKSMLAAARPRLRPGVRNR